MSDRSFSGLVAAGIVGVVVWAFGRMSARQSAPPQPVVVSYPTPQPRADKRASRAQIVSGLIDVAAGFLSGDTAGAQATAGAVFQDVTGFQVPTGAGGVSSLLSVIGRAEAPRGYNQVWGGIAAADRPPRALTTMTVNEVLAWQDSIDNRYNSEAAGRYQIMEDTLRDLVMSGAVSGNQLFNAQTQDACAVALMKRRGLDSYRAGHISAATFADRLAREWAGLPVQKDQRGHKRHVRRGQSYYAGDSLNAATVSPDSVVRAIGRIA
ncbi:MAG: hypothetical protein CSA72_08345 [Rhodobacterales bacterium]|nr:MAG: hypothetical protein CSA72_08345 [Rhodobacterales bacterium]